MKEVQFSVDLAQHNAAAQNVTVEIPFSKKAESLLEPIDHSRKIVLRFSEVSAHVATLKLKKSDATQEATQRQILSGVSGCCAPGELLAMMGPSGSGKTSLLSILGGRTPSALKTEGEISYNGERMSKQIKRSIGYVLQDDLLYETLTVYETLYFAAMLRMPRETSVERKIETVNTVILSLGLNKCRDTIIGGFFRRGVSGGERKRVSVAHELLINPSVLLLDEPTSGLDATTAMHLLTTLRALASGGRAIVTTIHQPSSRLYRQLDKLLLLSEGVSMYYGEARMVADWFHQLGYTMPYGVNAADFILDLASGDVLTKKLDGEQSRKHMVACAQRFLQSHPDGFKEGCELSAEVFGDELWSAAESRRNLGSDKPGSFRFLERMSSGATAGTSGALGLASAAETAESSSGLPSYLRQTTPAPPANGHKGAGAAVSESVEKDKGRRWGATYFTQIQILFQRTIKTRRFQTLAWQDVAQFLFIGILAGLFWFQKGKTQTIRGAQNLMGLLFFQMLFLSFRSMIGALFTFPAEHKMMLKERASGMYRLSAFYFARTASDLPIDCALPTIFILLIYFLGYLRMTPAAFFANWGSVVLTLLVSQTLGLFIGCTIHNPKTGQTIASVCALSMVLVSGFFVTNIAPWIGWMRYLSFIYYGYNLVLHVQLQGRVFYDCGGFDPSDPTQHLAGQGGIHCVPVSGASLQQALHLEVNPDTWPWEAGVMIIWLIVFRWIVYLVLRVRTSTFKG